MYILSSSFYLTCTPYQFLTPPLDIQTPFSFSSEQAYLPGPHAKRVDATVCEKRQSVPNGAIMVDGRSPCKKTSVQTWVGEKPMSLLWRKLSRSVVLSITSPMCDDNGTLSDEGFPGQMNCASLFRGHLNGHCTLMLHLGKTALSEIEEWLKSNDRIGTERKM